MPRRESRILMLSDVYFPRVNGVSTSIATFRQECARLGCRIDLLAPDYGHAVARELGVIRIRSRAVVLDREDRMMHFGALMEAATRLGPDYDLIHVQTPFLAHYAGVRLARRWRVPVIATYHTFFEEYLYNYIPFLPRSLLRALARAFSRSQCRALDGLVVPSTPMLETLRRYGITTPATVIPTGVEAREFACGHGGAFRARHAIPPGRPVLLFIGRTAHEKNIGFLIRVVQRVRAVVPEVLLLVAGEGPARGKLERQVKAARLQHHVRFVGYLSRRYDLKDCYSAADVFVFASRTETQGLVLLEALASGLPAVSTAVMGTKDVLHGTRGTLVAPDDVEEFAARVVLLLRDARLRSRLGRAARCDARRWSAVPMAQQLIGLYDRFAAAPHSCARPSGA